MPDPAVTAMLERLGYTETEIELIHADVAQAPDLTPEQGMRIHQIFKTARDHPAA